MELTLINSFQMSLMPKSSIKPDIPKKCFIYLKTTSGIAVVTQRKNVSIPPEGAAIISLQNIRLINYNNETSNVHGLTYIVNWGENSNILRNKVFIFDNHLDRDIDFNRGLDAASRTILQIINDSIEPSEQQFEKLRGNIDNRLIKVNRYIRYNYRNYINLQLLSDLIQSNPIYLCNTFSKVFGVSPIYYLNTIRIKEAKNLLINSTMTLKEISSFIGYTNSSQFSSIFKRYVDRTPGEYRLEHSVTRRGGGEFEEN